MGTRRQHGHTLRAHQWVCLLCTQAIMLPSCNSCCLDGLAGTRSRSVSAGDNACAGGTGRGAREAPHRRGATAGPGSQTTFSGMEMRQTTSISALRRMTSRKTTSSGAPQNNRRTTLIRSSPHTSTWRVITAGGIVITSTRRVNNKPMVNVHGGRIVITLEARYGEKVGAQQAVCKAGATGAPHRRKQRPRQFPG